LPGFSQAARLPGRWHCETQNTFFRRHPVCGRCDTRSDSAFSDDDLKKLRVYVLVGGEDDEAMIKSNKEAGKKLEKKGATVKINEFPGWVMHITKSDEELTKALRFILVNSGRGSLASPDYQADHCLRESSDFLTAYCAMRSISLFIRLP